MKSFMGRLAGAVAAIVVSVSAAAAADYRVVSFGDSLSDVGNLFDLAQQPPAPYYEGRFSNGPVWTEILAGGDMRHANAGRVDNTADTNFAFGGATANLGSRVPPVPEQIGSYAIAGGRYGAKDIVTVLGGANDLLALTAASSTAQAKALGSRTADAQARNIRYLIRAGAKIIVVPSLPPLDKTPRGLSNAALGKVFKTATNTFNARLKANVATIQAAHGDVRILNFDLAGLFAQAVANPTLVGLKDTTHPCLAVPACVGGSEDVQNTFLFWDDIHPTAQVHRIIAFMVRWDLEH